jgi:hypothetical protein
MSPPHSADPSRTVGSALQVGDQFELVVRGTKNAPEIVSAPSGFKSPLRSVKKDPFAAKTYVVEVVEATTPELAKGDVLPKTGRGKTPRKRARAKDRLVPLNTVRSRAPGPTAVIGDVPDASDYGREVLPVLADWLAGLRAAGQSIPEADDVAEMVRVLLPAPPGNPLATAIGRFYRSDAVMVLLGLNSKQALASRRRTGAVLAAKTADGTLAYPAFQFDVPGRRVDPNLAPVIRVLREVDSWSAALWLVTANADLDERSPLDALVDLEAVLMSAKHFVAATFAS